MNNYKYIAEIHHKFTHIEEITVEGQSENINDAEATAENKARISSNQSSYDAEYDGSDIEIIKLVDTDDKEADICRCEKTIEMFN